MYILMFRFDGIKCFDYTVLGGVAKYESRRGAVCRNAVARELLPLWYLKGVCVKIKKCP